MKNNKKTGKERRADVYSVVAAQITEQLEKGTIPWKKPWTGGDVYAYSAISGKPYSFLNQFLLDFTPGKWWTWNQIKAAGGSVRKGEHSRIICFCTQGYSRKETDPDTGEEKTVWISYEVPALRYYRVWHESQIDGIPQSYLDKLPTPDPVKIPDADEIISGYTSNQGIALRNVYGTRAYYSPSSDRITLPLVEQFAEISEYYSTAFHEMTHSTGHESRLNRLHKVAAFGDEEYSQEELTAELGSAFLCRILGIDNSATADNSAAYIAGWLKALQDDPRMLTSAASRAGKAVDFILEHLTPAPVAQIFAPLPVALPPARS